jgi:hypothetical protein
VDKYLDAIQRLYQKVDPTNRYPAEDKVRQFIDGLRDEIREPVEISCPINMDEALNKARAAEATFSRNAPLSLYSTRRNYLSQNNNEIQDIKQVLTQLTTGFQQLANTQLNNRTNNNQDTRTCQNCGRKGHTTQNCRSNRPNNNYNNRNQNNDYSNNNNRNQNNNYSNNNNRNQSNSYNNNNNRNQNNNYSNNNRNQNNNTSRTCYICDQPGHIAKYCPKKSNSSSNQNPPPNQTPNNENNQSTNRNQWLNLPLEEFAQAVDYVHQHLN